MRITPIAYRIANPIRKIYWRIFKPSVFGVRVLIEHPQNPDLVLMIRHTYGNRQAWSIPGGGYNPKKETPEQAAVREVSEEINLIPKNLKELGIHKTGGEGKNDTVTMFLATTDTPEQFKLGPEIAEIAWHDSTQIDSLPAVSTVARKSIKLADLK